MTKLGDNYAEVARVLGAYFDGLYNGDVRLLGQVFYPSAQLATISEGNLTTVDIPSWLAIVEKRESSAARKEVRLDKILSIEFGSENTAAARVQAAIGPKLFTDFLSLAKGPDGWRIVSKVYQFEALKA